MCPYHPYTTKPAFKRSAGVYRSKDDRTRDYVCGKKSQKWGCTIPGYKDRLCGCG